MNKQEENISDIITLDAIEKIVDIFLDYIFHTDKTVGIIANKELIEYAMGEVLKYDCVNVKKVDLELDDIEYMLSVDDDGNMIVQPVMEYYDKYFSAMWHVYISMDGDVEQTTIDNCLDRDVDVVLFGYEDESDNKENFAIDGKSVSKEEFDEYISRFKKLDDIDKEKYIEYSKDSDRDMDMFVTSTPGENLYYGTQYILFDKLSARNVFWSNLFF